MSEGRARGRSRGRARGEPLQHGESRKPGEFARGGGGQQQYHGAKVGGVGGGGGGGGGAWGGGDSGRGGPRGPTQEQRLPRTVPRPREDTMVGGGGGGDVFTEKMQGLSLGAAGDAAASGAVPVGRGALRGRREITRTVWTKPSTIESKKGEFGKKIALTANYFKLLTHTDWSLYQYRVDFEPEEDNTRVRKALLRNHKEELGGYIFDGTVLFTSYRIQPDPKEVFSLRESDQCKIRIIIKKAADLNMGDPHYIQFFNILMRKCLDHLKLQLVGRNYFDPHAKIIVEQQPMELWPGYSTSIRQHEDSILMCVEITHKVMRKDTVYSLMTDLARRNPHEWKVQFQQAIIGAIVLTVYNNSTYRIDDVDFSQRPDSTFELKNKEKISYIDYYKKKYQITIRGHDQPLLVSRAKARNIRAGMVSNIMLIPELCCLTGLTDEMRNDFQIMKALGAHTRVNPGDRINKLVNFNKRLSSTKLIQDDLKLWNMKLSSELVRFEGRILAPEKIVHGGGKKSDGGIDADFTKSLRGNEMLLMGKLEAWAVIYPSHLGRDTGNFVNTLIKCAQSLSFNIPQPRRQEIQNDRAAAYVEALDTLISHSNPQLIMCAVPRQRSDLYSAIKKKSCVDRAVPTQVVVARNMTSKGVMSIATKIAIQMNCKIGGAPWTVEIPMAGLMVVGFDVCHDTSHRGRSYGAMVASLDKALSRYYSSVCNHTTGEELSNYIATNLVQALAKYRAVNENKLPSRIIIYRDGVGEGQIPFVFEHEVEQIKGSLEKLYAQCEQPLKMAFVIVTKRINTRLFINDNNPPPGTIADDCITSPDRYDFFIVSQSVRQGTVSPTYYNVIYDTTGLSPDKMQRLTYKMTHLYYNWSGTVRVPAQCQYAHKLAFLVGQFLHRAPNQGLDDLLYFL